MLCWLIAIGKLRHVAFQIQPRKHEQVCPSLMHRPGATPAEDGSIGPPRVIDCKTSSPICELVQRTIYTSTVGALICAGARIDCFPLTASTLKMSMQLQLPASNSTFPRKRFTHSCLVSTA